MTEYIFQCRTSIGMPPWEYKSAYEDERHALEYAERLTANFAGTPWFMGLSVWISLKSVPELPQYRLIAEFVLDKPVVRRSV